MSTPATCHFCRKSCFAPLPAETPQAIRAAYASRPGNQHNADSGRSLRAATCHEGQAYDLQTIGYCWRDVRAALAILKLLQAVQQFVDAHGEGCLCGPCTFAQSAIWNAEEMEVINR